MVTRTNRIWKGPQPILQSVTISQQEFWWNIYLLFTDILQISCSYFPSYMFTERLKWKSVQFCYLPGSTPSSHFQTQLHTATHSNTHLHTATHSLTQLHTATHPVLIHGKFILRSPTLLPESLVLSPHLHTTRNLITFILLSPRLWVIHPLTILSHTTYP